MGKSHDHVVSAGIIDLIVYRMQAACRIRCMLVFFVCQTLSHYKLPLLSLLLLVLVETVYLNHFRADFHFLRHISSGYGCKTEEDK